MHFSEDNAVKINDIILEKDSQHFLFLNNSNTYNFVLLNDLKGNTIINIEVLIVSLKENQSIIININNGSYTLDSNDKNYLFMHNTKDEPLGNFGIKRTGKPHHIQG